MPNTSIVKVRNQKIKSQSGRCYYCKQPMWIKGCLEFCSMYKLTQKQARKFQCTAEHLHARCDGGGNAGHNIVAACLRCNQARHKARSPLKPDEYKKMITRRVANGKWHDKLPAPPQHTAIVSAAHNP